MTYNPERHLESATEELKAYVLANVNTRIYQIEMEFPGPTLDAMKMPVRKTLIHFEIDDQDDRTSFGDAPMTENYDTNTHTVLPQWAGTHVLNFDVGVWASDDSGGTTARLRAKQLLYRLFGYPNSVQALRDFTDGGDGCLEIIQFTGGMNVQDRINDVRLYRMVNGQLEIRVFSRTPIPTTPGPAIEDIVQAPNLTIIG